MANNAGTKAAIKASGAKKPMLMPKIKERPAVYEIASPTILAAQPAEPKNNKEQMNRDWETLRNHLESRLNGLRAWRYSWWMENWSDLAEFILPRRSIWLTQSAGGIPTPNNMLRGREINKSIVDPTATYAARICSGGLVSGLVSPSRPWFKLTAGNNRKDLDSAARKWIDETEERIYMALDASNFYESEAQSKEDLVVFGTAPTIIYEDARDIFHCYNPCVGEYYLANDSTNRINGFYRQYLDTIAQTIDFFGSDTPPDDIKAMWAQKGSALDTERIISHSIEPNFSINEDGVGKIPGNFAWREVYWVWASGSKQALSMRGFHDQPFVVDRWSLQSNDAYGRSPGMDILPDVLQLQVMTRRLAEAIEKQVRPPLLADMQMKNQPSSALPGSVTYVPKLGADTGMRSIYQVNPDVAALSQSIAAIEQRIKIGLFNDLFLMISEQEGDRRTATEIQAKLSEKIQVLGPVIEGMLGGLKLKLKRIYGILQRKGYIDPPPASLKGMPLDVDFISSLALAQKASVSGSMERIAGLIGNLAPVFPQAKYLLNVDSYVRNMNDILCNPADILNSPDEVKKQIAQDQAAMQHQAQMQQQAHAAQTLNTGAQAGQVLSQTQIGGGKTALDAMLQGAAGGQ